MPYSETEIASADFDQPEHAGPVRKIFICSTPRSGSNTLCRMMVSCGIGLPIEYFNPVLIPAMAARFGFDEQRTRAILEWYRRYPVLYRKLARDPVPAFVNAYAATLLRRRTRNGIFAAKMHQDHHAKLLSYPATRPILQGSVFVYVYREDLLSQAVSAHVSHLTGVWDFDGVVTTRPFPNPSFMSVGAIQQSAGNIVEQNRNWQMFFIENGIRPIAASFETFIRNPANLVGRIAASVGVAADLTGLAEAGGERYPEVQRPTKAEITAEYLKQVSRLSQ